MYKDHSQLTIEDFIFPFGALDPNNRWVRMASFVPWDEIEKPYAKSFGTTGAPAHPARMAFGALLLKQCLSVSDAELVNQIAENPYLQFFIGCKSFDKGCPFGASTLVAFRKRFPEDEVRRINDLVIARARAAAAQAKENNDDDHDDSDGGTLVMDATVAPSNIAYPQDVALLDKGREMLEALADKLCAQTGTKKPRMYRQRARRDFLNWSKAKRRSYKLNRRARRQQLGYVARDLGFIAELIEQKHAELTERDAIAIETISLLYAQQKEMHDQHKTKVDHRIVSIEQPWVRPVVRGKTHANTEFGEKLHLCIEDGFSRVDYASFEAYNEASRLTDAAKGYKMRHGAYPKRILADKIYTTRANRAWCKARGIELSGPKLGRPSKDPQVAREDCRRERESASDRNCVEGAFGTMKHSYGMDRVMTRLKETTETVVAMAVLCFNLKKLEGLSYTFIRWALKMLQSWPLLLVEDRGLQRA